MIRKVGHTTLVLLLALLVAAGAGTVGQETAGLAPTDIVITVTSTDDDYTDGKSKKCTDVPADECTLRRAINEAYSLAGGSDDIYINFDIPTNDPGYDSALQAWKIQLTGSTLYDLRELNGATYLDGSTQPGGRSDGPKIIVDGQGDKNNGLILRGGSNQVRGLAMQNFLNTHITLSSNANLVEDCWFGLSDDGTTLSSGDDTVPEGGSGVAFSAGVLGNLVRNNTFAGFFEVAAAIRGDDNRFSGNQIGTRADGTVPIPAQFDRHPCQAGAWTGGSGVTVEGDNNQIGGPTAAEGNLFAGLYLDVGPVTTQGPALDAIGTGHTIQNNVIGLDANGDPVGVCGRGLDFGGGPSDMMVLDNVIVDPGLSAILMNNWQCNGNTLQTNAIERDGAWPGEQGDNNFTEDAIAYGPTVPAALRDFTPAQVTQVDGVNVQGTSGSGSSCPDCTVELFLDDTDGTTEALQSLAVVTADGSGNWNATLPTALELGQGLRTMSTVPDNFTITGLDAGTTSNLSPLQVARYPTFLPLVVRQW